MSWPILSSALFAQPVLFGVRNLWAAGRHRGGADAGQAIAYLMIAAVVIAGVCLAIYFGSRILNRRRHYSHGALFSGLCQIHGLDRTARGLLRQLARSRQIPHPAQVFTEPKWLDPGGLPAAMRPQARKVAALRNRLFGESET